jgi:DNA-binding MarR family transcriptional regulator
VSGEGSGEGSGDVGIELGLLAAIERDSSVTQRSLARDLGIALGLANAYLRRCVRKGLVKMREAPINRYGYYLTPQGFAEKSRLTAEYLTVSFDFFRRARTDCAALFEHCEARGWRRVALYGAGELAEIATLGAGDSSVAVLCVIDPETAGRRCAGLAVLADLASARRAAGEAGLDAVILTDMRAPQASFEALRAAALRCGWAAERVIAPGLLRISRAPAPSLDEVAP